MKKIAFISLLALIMSSAHAVEAVKMTPEQCDAAMKACQDNNCRNLLMKVNSCSPAASSTTTTTTTTTPTGGTGGY